jgi:hypothetical protein
MAAAPYGSVTWLKTDLEFHKTVAAAQATPTWYQFLIFASERVRDSILASGNQQRSDDLASITLGEHQQILDAIEAGDPEAHSAPCICIWRVPHSVSGFPVSRTRRYRTGLLERGHSGNVQGSPEMTGRLEGKTAVVTAAGQGMGRAAVLAFSREGRNDDCYRYRRVETAVARGTRPASRRNHSMSEPRGDQGVRSGYQGARYPLQLCRLCPRWLHPRLRRGRVRLFGQPQCAGDVPDDPRVPARHDRARRWSIVNMASVASTVIAAPNRFIYGTTKAAVIG